MGTPTDNDLEQLARAYSPRPRPGAYEIRHTEIAKELGISRQRVGVLERRALKKLRKMFAAAGYKKSDFF